MMSEAPKLPEGSALRLDTAEDGALWRLRLDRPKTNILDTRLIKGLASVFWESRRAPQLKAIFIEGAGDHFSFGASIEEHRVDEVAAMLRCFRTLFEAMLEASVFTIAVVRGQCLGGGLELASFCNRMIASPSAKFGQPEIVLGVLAPVASVYLPERVGRAVAEDLCLSGRIVDAVEAHRLGLVDEVADDPAAAAESYFRNWLRPRSASSLRVAHRTIRAPLWERVLGQLARAEQTYLNELMKTDDANEGIAAFLEKRPPLWRNA
ncbi:MAG: enoyl-CoA hydratase-related protein [Nannocystaceae bacterium]